MSNFKKTVTFLSDYDGIFKATDMNNTFFFTISIKVEDFTQMTIPEIAYEIESLNNEIKRNNIEEGYFTEATYPFIF